MKRTIRVTITKELEVELPPGFFDKFQMTEAEYLEEFRRYMWPIEGIDDVFKYAARMAACYGSGREHDSLGLLAYDYTTYPRVPDVKFRELSEEIEEEILLNEGSAQ